MNLVGKIFTVLIFLMSIVFATFALSVYTTHKNWRAVVDNAQEPLGLSQRLDKAKSENTELLKKKKDLEEERKVEKERSDKVLAQLESENQELRKERTENEKKIAELDAAVRDAVGGVKAAHETLANLRKQVETLREDIKTAQADRDDKFKKVVALTDDVHNAVNERMRLEKMNRDLIEQLSKAREALKYVGVNENSNYKDKEPPAGLQGQVTGVPRPDLVEVSVGSDDGLRKGHKLEVVRVEGGNTVYVGRVEVVEAAVDRAVCRTDPKMLRSPVQRGDRVFANLQGR